LQPTGRLEDAVMASQQRDDNPGRGKDHVSEFIYVPCPACRRGVQLSAENRLADEDDVYECPACGARLVVAED
jgi:DNA-directed RNA polymerase subunit RPC12/RpoP